MTRLHELAISFVGALACLPLLQACGNGVPPARTRTGTALASAPTARADTGKPVPLSADDIELYAAVLRAAAQRVERPTGDDERILARARQAQKGSAGTDPATLASYAADLERAVELKTHIDDDIVRERHLDPDRYSRIRDRIEAVIPPIEARGDADAADATPEAPAPAVGAGAPSDAAGAAPEPGSPAEVHRRQALQAAFSADSAALAPHRAELQRLIWRVRMSRMN